MLTCPIKKKTTKRGQGIWKDKMRKRAKSALHQKQAVVQKLNLTMWEITQKASAEIPVRLGVTPDF